MSTYNELYQESKKALAEKVSVEFDMKLQTYCSNIFGSKDYYRFIKNHITKGIITVTNKDNWSDPFEHACSPYIKAVPLIRDPYSFNINAGQVRLPVFARTLNDLAMLINRMQDISTKEITVQDFGIFLYIMFTVHMKELQEVQGYTYKQSIYTVQQLLLQFFCNISASTQPQKPRVRLYMYDSLGMFQFLKEWNMKEYQQRMRSTPFYTEWSPEKIASFYSAVCPMFRDISLDKSRFLQPFVVYERTEYLPALDKKFLSMYFNKYGDKRTVTLDEAFLLALKSRDKNKYYEFAEKNFEWKDLRKLYLLGRKRRQCYENVEFSEPVLVAWSKHTKWYKHRRNEPYNPFEVDTSSTPIFANTVLDYTKLTQEYPQLTKSKLKEVYLMAQTINQARRKYYGFEGDAVFMSLHVDVINVPEENKEVVTEVIKEANRNLESTYMDNFAVTIHEDTRKFAEYIKQIPWYNKVEDNGDN